MQEHCDSGSHIKFHEPEWYKQTNWTKSSDISWKQVCHFRAQEIRDSYKTVKLLFSGGCDSVLVLDSFVTNRIHIDEIVLVECGIESADYEITQAKHLLKKYQLPKTKITVITADVNDYENFYLQDNWYDRANFENNGFWFRMHHRELYKQMYIDADDVCNVTGHQKPFMLFKDNEWWIQSIDINTEQMTSENVSKEEFFSGSADILRTQFHMAIDYIQSQVDKSQYNTLLKKGPMSQQHMNLASGRINTLDQPFIQKQKQDTFIKYKNKKLYCYNYKEAQALKWAVDNMPHAVDAWKKTVDQYSKLADGVWYNQGRPEYGWVGIFAPFYSLTTNTVKTVDELFPDGYCNQ